MEKIIATATVNDNQVQLVKQNNSYFIYWGEPLDQYQSKTELLTPKGRIPSEGGAIKQFLKATKAAQYLKFSKL